MKDIVLSGKAKRVLFTVLFAMLLLQGTVTAWGKDATYHFKMATLAPRGIGWAQEWENILYPSILRSTQNQAVFKVYYGGIMGDDEDIVKKIRIGQLDAGAITGQGAILACPQMTVLELPFLFNDYNEVDYVKKRMYDIFDDYAQKSGFKLLYWFDQDFDQIYSLKYPLNCLSDFQEARFLTWYGPVENTCLEFMGANPIPINGPEVPSALRQKVIDSLIAPSIWVVGSQTYSIIRYVNPIKIRYAPGMVVISSQSWHRLPEEYRNAIINERPKVQSEYITATREANAKALAAIIRYGVKEVKVPPERLAQMKAQTIPVWEKLAGVEFPAALLEKIKDHLATYRQQNNQN